MSRLISRVLGGSLLLLAMHCTIAEPAAVRADNNKPMAPQNAGASGAMTQEQLLEMVTKMGYTAEVVKSTAGGSMNKMVIERSGMTFTVYISLSPNGQYVWLIAPLANLPDPAKVPAERFIKLLEENYNRQPVNFDIRSSGKWVYLSRPLENRDVTPARLREAIENFVNIAVETYPLWKSTNWTVTEPTPATTAPMATDPQLQGKWKVVSWEMKGQKVADDKLRELAPEFTVAGNRLTAQVKGNTQQYTLIIDLAKTPRSIDLTGSEGQLEKGMYKIEGDTLTICVGNVGQDRPTAFATTPTNNYLIVLKREAASTATK